MGSCPDTDIDPDVLPFGPTQRRIIMILKGQITHALC